MSVPESYLVECREPVGYLDFARYGPPVHAVVAETTRLLERSAQAGQSTVDDLMRQDLRARSAVARLAGAGADRVALLPNTSTGLFQAASGLVGEVLVARGEFPANTYPWVRGSRARVRWLDPGPVTPEVVRAALTPGVTAVSVSAVDFRTGYRADLGALRDVIGDRVLVVDAIQGFGVVDEPWAAADVVVAGGQKWLRAGWSTGFAVLSDRALERVRPTLSGWTGAIDGGLFNDSLRPPSPDATAWSLTHLSPVAAGALAAAVELVESAGVPALNARIVQRIAELAEAVHAAGGTVVSDRRRSAGILAFRLPDAPSAVVGAALARAGVTATTRADHVRLSPHASTTAETIALVAETLRTTHPAQHRSPAPAPAAPAPVASAPAAPAPAAPVPSAPVPGVLPPDVGTYRRMLVERALAEVGVPVELMRKAHKARVVRYLDDAGLFQVRDSVGHVAAALGVTRFTIYNYLNEIRPRPAPGGASGGTSGSE
ncbi:aminotransferase class V-fold PLP-dependent enzyme [Actinosynnema sp. NPDC050436]|uniref:aminotransferase class V-fold PLP-dependent enzyme n=1 Tax=Actinosynnema sp. NPDC050436 TaxID=3155659 RepID=UPI0033D775B8